MAREGEMPTMTSSAYGMASSNYGNLGMAGATQPFVGGYHAATQTVAPSNDAALRRMLVGTGTQHVAINALPQQEKPPMATKDKLRIVRVFLVDPDERVPLDQRILYKSDEITTEATDQELYFDIQVADLLRTHNKTRQGILHKEPGSKEAAEPLKEIRIRDLVMSVTTIAEFALR